MAAFVILNAEGKVTREFYNTPEGIVEFACYMTCEDDADYQKRIQRATELLADPEVKWTS